MGSKFSKFINTNKSKKYWAYILFGVLLTIISVVFMPFWKDRVNVFFASWGHNVVNVIIAVLIILYLIFIQVRQLEKKTNKVIKALTITEFILLTLIAISLVLSQFNVLPIKEPSQILGVALYLRGFVELFKAYYYKHDTENNENKFSVLELLLAILFITIGTWCIVTNYITKALILWVITIAILVIAILLIVLGIVKKPKTPKKIKKIKNTKKKGEDSSDVAKEEETEN